MSVRGWNKFRRKHFPTYHPLDGPIGKRIPPRGRPRALTREKSGEYCYSVKCSYDELVQALSAYGYSSNPLSTLKYVSIRDGRSWEVGTMAYRPKLTGKWQHHAYWFEASESSKWDYHIWHHKERNYLDIPSGITAHTGGNRESGDPDSNLYYALNKAGIRFEDTIDQDYTINE